jgi:DNA polymerase-3 subunit delta'
MELNWLNQFVNAWLERSKQERIPHAVILTGSVGVGKRCAASWIARQRLGIKDICGLPEYPIVISEHVDLQWVCPFEDKHTIGIEQIRELVTHLSLTSFKGDGKVVVIEPANLMTANAANGLLKTLEEPIGDTLLVLVADKIGQLPATIFSRCQHINIPIPPESESLAWLNRLEPSIYWPQALRAAGNAPLAAILISENIETMKMMSCDFGALSEKKATPLDVAEKWIKYEPQFVLDWLCHEIQKYIYDTNGISVPNSDQGTRNSVLKRIDKRNMFYYLDIINRLRNQPANSFNVQLTLESLLIDWSEDLKDCSYTADLP